MRSLKIKWMIALAAVCLLSISAAVAAPKPGFTLKDAQVQVQGGRLTYSVTVCTKQHATLMLASKFTPSKSGAPVAAPGATQYQAAGCWSALVGVAIVNGTPKQCTPLACPVVRGRAYRIVVKVTDKSTHGSLAAPVLTATA